MWFWIIRVFWKEGSEEKDGLFSMPVPTDKECVLAYTGLVVFNTREEAQTFIEERLADWKCEPTPLRHTAIIKTVDSEHEGTPNRIFYLGGYKEGDQMGRGATSEQFNAWCEF